MAQIGGAVVAETAQTVVANVQGRPLVSSAIVFLYKAAVVGAMLGAIITTNTEQIANLKETKELDQLKT